MMITKRKGCIMKMPATAVPGALKLFLGIACLFLPVVTAIFLVSSGLGKHLLWVIGIPCLLGIVIYASRLIKDWLHESYSARWFVVRLVVLIVATFIGHYVLRILAH